MKNTITILTLFFSGFTAFGQEKFEALYNRRKQVLKLSIPEIQELIKHYKNKTKELKLNP